MTNQMTIGGRTYQILVPPTAQIERFHVHDDVYSHVLKYMDQIPTIFSRFSFIFPGSYKEVYASIHYSEMEGGWKHGFCTSGSGYYYQEARILMRIA